MKFSRRNFLQNASLSIASLGGFWGNIHFSQHQLNAYAETLNSSTSRKLALLVGVNQYSQGNNLRGCVTDIELQKELLTYRFGFSPDDIVTLTNSEATRENILTAFEEHLIKQAKNNDVVIFHFSGYGRQIKLKNNDGNFTNVNSIITYDSVKSNNDMVDDILMDTFRQLASSLKTNKYTFIFDTSFVISPPSNNHQTSSRSYGFNDNLFISDTEINFNKNLQKNKKSSPLSGLLFIPFKDSLAIEIKSLNFNVGLFTYLLTQSLWANLSDIDSLTLIKNITSNISLYTGKSQKLSVDGDQKNITLPYNLSLDSSYQGNAIVKNTLESNIIELDLLGLPLLVLLNYSLNSCFTGNVEDGKTVTIQINSLLGNKGKGSIISSNKNLVKQGLILKESLRVIAKNIGLNIALNDSLEKIEKVDATSTLSAINEIESVVNLGDNFVDLIFGKVANQNTSIHSYGLFTTSGVLLANTYSNVDNEAISAGIKHLIPTLKVTLAQKLIELISNQYSSLLSANINVEISNNNEVLNIQQETNLSNNKSIKNTLQKLSNNDQNLLKKVSIDSQLIITINNKNNQDLYYLLIAINSSDNIMIYFSPDNKIITSLNSITIPQNKKSLKWIINPDKGISKLMLICSKSPFTQTLNQLYKNSNLKPDIEQVIVLENPVMMAKAILEDLHLGSNISNDIVSNSNDVYALDLNQWATFEIIYEII